ncbi:OmpA family protein [Massilia sp. W12]|uniref:OmpA family protein n=1 Tax=Massilia sp. W12 TaxID=3126507 RepID=UPI0030D4349A
MKRFSFSIKSGLAGAMLLLSAAAMAQSTKPAVSPQQVMSDQGVLRDMQSYRQAQARIKAQNEQGVAVADYLLSKAQCWLDVSLHEYTRNDRSDFPQQALAQADLILQAMEQKQTPNPGLQTPLLNQAERLRDDLWQRFANLKTHPGFRCASALVACAEVELAHAGNEYKQQGWRHANPYIQIAEDKLALADAAAAACPVTPPPPPAPCQPCKESTPPRQVKKLSLQADALFRFDQHSLQHLLPQGRARIDEAMRKLEQAYTRIDYIKLVGHTDRLGSQDYNLKLSRNRAKTVADYIRSKGYQGELMHDGVGKTQQIIGCEQIKARSALIDCLQPNRRVEIEVSGELRALPAD